MAKPVTNNEVKYFTYDYEAQYADIDGALQAFKGRVQAQTTDIVREHLHWMIEYDYRGSAFKIDIFPLGIYPQVFKDTNTYELPDVIILTGPTPSFIEEQENNCLALPYNPSSEESQKEDFKLEESTDVSKIKSVVISDDITELT